MALDGVTYILALVIVSVVVHFPLRRAVVRCSLRILGTGVTPLEWRDPVELAELVVCGEDAGTEVCFAFHDEQTNKKLPAIIRLLIDLQ